MIKALLLLMTVAVFATVARADDAPDTSAWWGVLSFQPVGTFTGEGNGKWGHSTLERTYDSVLGGRFLMGKNTSTYAPQEKNPDGEVHTNWDIFSHDEERDTWVLRQFHDEGFVNTYVMDSINFDLSTAVFTSEHIENFMPGWRARETYRILGPDEFTETFELAGPGEEFRVFVENHFTRKK